ncbi:MAG: adenylate kinase [Spirochaetaceae bacterium]|jgi:adenylate kinase|nr:adenylate kinase [Spirochaetaceae bacterium]
MNFVFLGPPGAGKGTLAKEVAAAYRIPHISTGDIFRAAVKEGIPLGLKVKSILDSGALVGDDVTIALVQKRLVQPDTRAGFILDGFPRTIPQAEALAGIARIDAAVNFEIADRDVVKRLSGRRVCKACGFNHHAEFSPSKKDGVCDKCGGELFIREDDKADAITHRLEVYRTQTAPLIDFYRGKNLLMDIDARPKAEAILMVFKAKFKQ